MSQEDEFLAAVQADEDAKVRAMLDRNPELIHAETAAGSIILTATYYGAERVRDLLLPKVSDLNVFEAAAVGDARRLREILEEDGDRLDAANRDGFTPLGLAAFFGHTEAVELLLGMGADIDRVDASVNANTALDAAVAANRTDAAKVLLAAGAQVNVRSRGGYTPLHKAAANGNLELTRLLLERGAAPSAQNEDGKTPLALAAERGKSDVVLELQKFGAVT